MKPSLFAQHAPLIATVIFIVGTSIGQPPEQLKRASELFRQGSESYSNNHYDDAIAKYSEYVKIRPTVAPGWYNRGLAYRQKAEAAMNRADFERAEADFSQAIKLDSKDADYWLQRGNVRLRLVPVDFNRQVPQAIADYTEAIKLRPDLALAYRGRGQVYAEANRQAEAMVDLSKAIQLDPNDYVALYTRGKLYSFEKKYAAARADLESAIRLFPGYEAAKGYLNFVNSSEASSKTAPSSASTAITGPPVVRPPTTASPPSSAISDPHSGHKMADDAARARDHPKVIDAVTKTLPLIKMESEGVPVDDLTMTHVYLDLLRKRARAHMALKRYNEANADYKRAAMDALTNMNRYNAKAAAELRAPSAIHTAGIMGGLQTGFSTIVCKSSFDSVSEWIATVGREQPDEMIVKLSASVLMGATREICAATYVMHGTFETLKSTPRSPSRTAHLNTAIERYTEAIKYMQVYRAAYIERAKVYRELGRTDLAAADEKKASELPVSKR